MIELLNNNWFISIASSLITLAIVPVAALVINNIRARNGVLSGTFIAITTTRSKEKIIELVKCKHVKNKIKGKIYGVANIPKETTSDKIQNNNKYAFKGTVAERLLVISYSSASKGDLSAGSLTLNGNTGGTIFAGIWGGLEEGKIVSSRCVWMKADRNLSLAKDYDTIIALATMQSPFVIMGTNSSGKTNAIGSISEFFDKR